MSESLFLEILIDIHSTPTTLIFLMIFITKEQLTVLVKTANVIHVNRSLVKKIEFNYSTGHVEEFNWEDEEGQMFSQPVNSELFEYYQSTGQVRWNDPEFVSVLVSFYVTTPLMLNF
jgi:hypothetical protein